MEKVIGPVLFGVLFALAACNEERVAQAPIAKGPPPIPILDRPVDLATFDPNVVDARVTLRDTDGAEGDAAALFSPAPADIGSYWRAPAPMSIEIDLGRMCYVSAVVVYPFTEHYGIGECRVDVTSGGIDSPIPVGQHAPKAATALFDRPAAAVSIGFFPKYTNRVHIDFASGASADPGRIYVRKIRVLGVPDSSARLSVETTGAESNRLESGGERINVARFEVDSVAQHIAVSEDRTPNGRFDLPWTDSAGNENAYWCATAPAWVAIDLGQECLIDEVIVDGISPGLGVGPAYVKLTDESGTERETAPPGDLANEGGDHTARFEPARTQRLKIYLAGPPSDNAFIHVREIRVMGTRATDGAGNKAD